MLFSWLMNLNWFRTRNFQTVWMVNSPCACSYKYSSYNVPHVPMTPFVSALGSKIANIVGAPADYFNSVNINLYANQHEAVGWHADDEPLFQACFQPALIVSLSLGSSRVFECRSNQSGTISRILLQHGDILTMENMFQRDCQHRVPRSTEECGPRINLTWRRILQHTSSCPLGGF